MGLIFRSNTRVSNLRVGPLSGGGGGGSSEPTYLIVGSRGDNSYRGAGFVFEISNLSNTPTKLVTSDNLIGAKLGTAASAFDGTIALSALGASDETGAVYVYDSSNLSASATKLTAFDGAEGDKFGQSVTVSSTKIAVGAHLDNSYKGAVYVYDKSNLSTAPTKLTAYDAANFDRFGYSAGSSGTVLAVGSPEDDDNGSSSGAVYVYDTSNLSTTPTKLVPSDVSGGDFFGKSVFVTSNHIVAGAHESQAVYVYDVSNLSASPTKLTPYDGISNARYGEVVAASDTHIVVTAYDDNSSRGSVYVYDATNLSTTPTKLQGVSTSDYFGISVTVLGSVLAVGAERVDTPSYFDEGAVYVYDLNNLSSSPTVLTSSTAIGNGNFGSSVTLL